MRFTVTGNLRERVAVMQTNLRAIPEQTQSIAQETIDRSEDTILDILGFEPPKAQFRYGDFPWESEKQRRYVLGFVLKGKKYTRKGKKPRGWRIFGKRTPTGAVVIVRNENPTAKYLHGRFDTVKPQQRFHHLIGWTTASANRQRVFIILIDTAKQVATEQLIQSIKG